ncbi:hypothetical protein ANN_06270 [Periplaneta americana]|uniref:Uncharacterized protein n=1 Tax=Periplaneta americana TaxID=6978 RepID=A0ABQ8TD35_PERAM|nr:hypothetical protein ANN_06270 [Periplaneta americana]
MAGLCEGGNEPPGSLKAITELKRQSYGHPELSVAAFCTQCVYQLWRLVWIWNDDLTGVSRTTLVRASYNICEINATASKLFTDREFVKDWPTAVAKKYVRNTLMILNHLRQHDVNDVYDDKIYNDDNGDNVHVYNDDHDVYDDKLYNNDLDDYVYR